MDFIQMNSTDNDNNHGTIHKDAPGGGGGDSINLPHHTNQQHRPVMHQGLALSGTEEEIEAKMNEFAKKDDDQNKTWTRRVVENYLSKSKLYFPMSDKEGGPSLSSAYAFYEHVTLPRHFVGSDNRAEPGESKEPTLLYDPFKTHASSFAEWGIGVDLYFATLKMVSAMLFVAGLINLHNIMFYASSNYNRNGQNSVGSFLLRGTALCTTLEWIVCRDCQADDFRHDEKELGRLGIAEDGTVLALHNDCNGADNFTVGMVNYITFLFLLGSMFFMSLYLRAREVRADEDKLTATDYSIMVKNPPPKATDPDEWRDFFEKFVDKQVTCVTVALDNDALVRKLIEHRIVQNKLRLLLPCGTNMDDNEAVCKAIEELTTQQNQGTSQFTKTVINPLLEATGIVSSPKTIYKTMLVIAEQVRELQKKEYNVSKVFVTFETEEGQRRALKSFSVGKLAVWMNNTNGVNSDIVFRDRVLAVEEPAEPDSIRWMDLSSSFVSRCLVWCFSLVITLIALVFSGICVFVTRERYGPYLAGILVSVFNSIIPELVLYLLKSERHISQGSYQTSLYVKITLFRWVNTAVLTKMVTPLTSTLSTSNDDILPSINAILISQLFVTPILSLMDISTNFKKHVLAPRAKTQGEMNSYFLGTQYDIGERYTSLTNIMFVCFFYSALFPATLFYGSFILLFQHYADKFCLMRIWSWHPTVGSELARFSRRYFFYGSLVAFVWVSAYTWAQYPFDNLCSPVNDVSRGHLGDYRHVQLGNGTTLDSVSVESDTDFMFCSQSPLDGEVFPFPPTSRLEGEDLKYMTDSQRKLVDYYGWTALVTVVGYLVCGFGSDVLSWFYSIFNGTYVLSGSAQHIDFSANVEIYGYIPQIWLPGLSFPLLACDVDDIYQGLIGWTDETNSYDYHNLMFDVPYEGMKRKARIQGSTRNKAQISDPTEYAVEEASESTGLLSKTNPIFSVIKHYPPPWLQQILDCKNEEPPAETHGENADNDSGHDERTAPSNGKPNSMLHSAQNLFGGLIQGMSGKK